jgi:hypothetical protein
MFDETCFCGRVGDRLRQHLEQMRAVKSAHEISAIGRYWGATRRIYEFRCRSFLPSEKETTQIANPISQHGKERGKVGTGIGGRSGYSGKSA